MKRILVLAITFLFISSFLFSQNVGIGTPTPGEKLDVNGNINLTGTIKANGVDGTANQVLMKNSSGVLAWSNMCEFNNYASFQFTSSGVYQSWIVPAGVTKIKVQVWGGGGKAGGVGGTPSSGAGGGGGGYIEGYLTVTPASTVNVRIGSGANNTIPNAQATNVEYGSQSLNAWGGTNANWPGGTNPVSPGLGGTFYVSNTINYIGINGENGNPDIVRFDQVSSTNFVKAIYYGDGGNAGNANNTSGKGGYLFVDTGGGTIYSNTLGSKGGLPGGGGGNGNYSFENAGGNGMVIIHY